MEKLREATVKATGNKIEVYRINKIRDGHRTTWCDFKDCKTEYNSDDINFLDGRDQFNRKK